MGGKKDDALYEDCLGEAETEDVADNNGYADCYDSPAIHEIPD